MATDEEIIFKDIVSSGFFLDTDGAALLPDQAEREHSEEVRGFDFWG